MVLVQETYVDIGSSRDDECDVTNKWDEGVKDQ